MNPVYFNLFIVFCYVSGSEVHETRSAYTHTVHKKLITLIDVLEDDLRNETWREDEKTCYDRLILNLNNVRNATLWSTLVWDSMQLPVGVLFGSRYQLGNFDECIRPPWLHSHPELRTQYCLANVHLTKSKLQKAVKEVDPHGSAETYINTLTKFDQELNVIKWGVCMPITCKKPSISKFLKILYKNSHLGYISRESDPVITVDSCQVAGAHRYSTGFHIFWIVMLSLMTLAIFSTYIVNNDETAGSSVTVITKSFCLKRNMYDLVKVIKDDDIPVLHGIRVISAIIIVFVHGFMFMFTNPASNGLDIDKFLEWIRHLVHLDIVVDTFLLMSGLLHAKGLMSKQDNPFLVLLKRYIRLIGPYALAVFFASQVASHTGSGPMWPGIIGNHCKKTCTDNWWISILMISNYIKSNEMCYPVSWYIACDYQLTILGTMLFWIFWRNRQVGKLVFAAVSVLAVILPGISTYWNNQHALLVYNIDSVINFLDSKEFSSTYTRSPYRMGPYLIGLAMGYIVTIYKPVNHRNIISTKLSTIIGVTSLITLLIPLIVAGNLITSEYNALNEAVFASTNRLIWVLSIKTLIILSEYGTTAPLLAIVVKFLAWPVWVPLSRLSYGLYIVHPFIIYRNMSVIRTALQAEIFITISNTFGVVFVGYICSLLIWLFVQAPFVNVMNGVLNQRAKLSQRNGYVAHEKSN